VIVTGAGRAFCAGADLSAGGGAFAEHAGDQPKDASAAPVRDGGGIVVLRIFDCLKPVIAAVNGNAVGVGVTMTLPMDVRMVSTAATKIGFVFARRGITPEAASSWFLPRVVGISQAMEWVATGRIFDHAEGVRAGLFRSAHAPDELLPAARALAHEMAEGTSPVSVALSRQLMWRMLGASHPMEAHRADSRAMAVRGASADAAEGVTSFLEKRPARFPLQVSTDLPDIFPEWDQPEYR
jgi:enoyl-CoA hydratase/carnithine racemase